jgi:hypothetical protein
VGWRNMKRETRRAVYLSLAASSRYDRGDG